MEKERKERFNDLSSEIRLWMESQPNAPYLNGLRCQNAWERIAPDHILKHSDNVVLREKNEKNTILVFVDNPSYAAELSMEKEYYRLVMAQELDKNIDDIRFITSKQTAIRKEFHRRDQETKAQEPRPAPRALFEEEIAEIKKMTAVLDDPELREKFYCVISKDFVWKKPNG
jgi:hypothetical protein